MAARCVDHEGEQNRNGAGSNPGEMVDRERWDQSRGHSGGISTSVGGWRVGGREEERRRPGG